MQAELVTYDAATGTELAAHGAAIAIQLGGLNDLSPAEVAAELATYDAATGSELTAAVVSILAGQLSAQQVRDAMALGLGPVTIDEDSLEHARLVLTNRNRDNGSSVQEIFDDAGGLFSSAGLTEDANENLVDRQKLVKP